MYRGWQMSPTGGSSITRQSVTRDIWVCRYILGGVDGSGLEPDGVKDEGNHDSGGGPSLISDPTASECEDRVTGWVGIYKSAVVGVGVVLLASNAFDVC